MRIFQCTKRLSRQFYSSIATFRADGKVGIGFTNPKELFHVEGNITGSGNISAAGNLSIDGTATVRTIDAGSAAITSALVTTTAGVVQKIAAAPVPVGGNIMWSGTVSNIPAGWTTIATLQLMFGSLNILLLGFMGMYIGKIFDETKKRPKYLIEKTIKKKDE